MDNENSRGILPSGKTIASWFGVLLVIAVVLFGGFVTLFVNHVDQHEFGYMVERLKGGKLSTIAQKGYIVTPPFVTKVYTIDTRPAQRCITSGRATVNQRVLNCKLVSFNPLGLDEFITLHGVQEGNVSDILEPYAFDQLSRPYTFLIIKDASAPQEKKQ